MPFFEDGYFLPFGFDMADSMNEGGRISGFDAMMLAAQAGPSASMRAAMALLNGSGYPQPHQPFQPGEPFPWAVDQPSDDNPIVVIGSPREGEAGNAALMRFIAGFQNAYLMLANAQGEGLNFDGAVNAEIPSLADIWANYPTLTDLIVNGQDVNPEDFVLANPETRYRFEQFAQRVLALDPSARIEITGGDRYRDADGVIRSSTNNSVVNDSAQRSQHLFGRAIDFGITTSLSEDDIRAIAAAVGYDFVRRYPTTGHYHVDYRTPGG